MRCSRSGIYEKEPFESYFSGNTIQICPVGALTSAAYRFRSRPFDLVSTPSIAEHDACGSAIRVDHRRGQVMRRLAGDDPEVNEEWITDKDRFAFAYGRADDRLTRPLVRDGDVLRPASWPEAIDVAVQGLQAAGRSSGVLTGGRLTVEDAYAYAKFARTVLGTNNIDFRARQHSDEEADFLAHVVAGSGRGVTFADLESASSVLLVCFEPEEEAGALFLRLRKANRKQGLKSWTLAPYLSNGARKIGAQLLPTVPGAEAAALDAAWLAGSARRELGDHGRRARSRPLRHPQRVRSARRSDRGPAGLGAPPSRRPGGGRGRVPAQPASRRATARRCRGAGRHPGHLGRRLAAQP